MKKSVYHVGLLAALFLLFFSANAFAAEDLGWRPWYDLAMRWVNFAIIVFLVVKFAWGPLTNWLKDQGREVAKQLDSLERRKQIIQEQMAEAKDQIQKRSEYMEGLMSRVTETAKNDKTAMIEQARAEGRQMIHDARRRADYKIAAARETFRAELIDEAVRLAHENLPKVISSEDEARLQADYLAKALH